jgi:6-phosphogluconolactonase
LGIKSYIANSFKIAMKSFIIFLTLVFPIVALSQNTYLLIGTYTSTKSEGIYVYKFDTTTAENSFVSVAKTSNPSFVSISANKKFVYAVNENDDSTINPRGGTITALSFNKINGILTEINRQPSGGKHPCYISVDKTGKWVFAGNYSSGTVSMFATNKDGSINKLQQVITHEGSSVNVERQKAPHVHATVLSADNKYLFVPDLGIDKVMIYAVDNKKGTLNFSSYAKSEPGSGPRHFTFHSNNKYAYLMEELTGTVVVYEINKGTLKFIQRISDMPKDYTGAMGSADINVSPDGKFLYCSNRGESNTISIFSINAINGKLTIVGYQSTLGKTPRNFNFDPSGNFLLVANQNTDEIVIFKIDKKTGLLTDSGKRINVPKPVCLQWIN